MYACAGDGLDKERLKALGMGAFASYGVISNLNYGTALGMAWLAYVKKTGLAPTAPGQWPSFLAFYAGGRRGLAGHPLAAAVLPIGRPSIRVVYRCVIVEDGDKRTVHPFPSSMHKWCDLFCLLSLHRRERHAIVAIIRQQAASP
jgi:hypothetical protein